MIDNFRLYSSFLVAQKQKAPFPGLLVAGFATSGKAASTCGLEGHGCGLHATAHAASHTAHAAAHAATAHSAHSTHSRILQVN